LNLKKSTEKISIVIIAEMKPVLPAVSNMLNNNKKDINKIKKKDLLKSLK